MGPARRDDGRRVAVVVRGAAAPRARDDRGPRPALAAVVHALVARLAERFDAGERLPSPATWRIAENRWSACRHGLDGAFADLETGESRPTREHLLALLAELGPVAQRLGCATELAGALALARVNGAQRQRAVAAERGVTGLAGWLADRFLG